MSRYEEPLVNGFERAAERFSKKTAILYLGTRFTYRRLKELIDRFAAALADIGVKKGDRVMLYIPNCPQFIIAYLATQKAGGVPVPISPIYTPHEIRYLVNDSGAETIVCMDTNFGYVREIFSDTCLKRIIWTNYIHLLPCYKRFIGRLFDKVPHGKVESGENIYSFRKLLSSYPPTPPNITIDPRNDLCYILYTGGTTGFPKGCLSTHAGMVSFVEEICCVGEGYIGDGEEVFVMVNPLFHQLAQGIILGMVLTKGNTAILIPIPVVDAILDAVQRYRATLFLGAPTLYRMILENDRLEFYDLSTLKYCWSGGDFLPREIYNKWNKKINTPIRQVFGASEVGFVAMSPLGENPVLGSIGAPLPSRDIKIVDSDSLEDVELNTAGELLVSSEYIQTSYWNKPEETAASYIKLDGKVWYRMKDYVRRDSEGFLYYVDRGADIIKHKGFRVSCSEIESVLQDHPAVVGACVVGVPDQKLGERIKAIVVLKEDTRGVGGPELIRICREKLAAYKVPQYIEFRDMLPKSKVGKLLRREIRDEERRKTEKGEKSIKV